MADSSALMLTELHGVDPNVLSAVPVQADGSQGSVLTVTSLPTGGDIARARFYQSSVTAATGDGAFVAWREYIPNDRNSDEFQQLLVRRYRSPGGQQSPALIRARPTGSVYNYRLAALPSNGAVVAWIEALPEDPDRSPIGPTSLYVATYSDANGWSAPTRLAGFSPEQPIGINDVTVGTSTNGHIVVLWSQTVDIGLGDTLMAAARDPDGHWGIPALVYETNDTDRADSLGLGVAVDGFGNAMAVWEYRAWDENVYGSGFNRMDAKAGWLGAETISEFAVDPKVVVNAAGHGLIVWGQDGYVLAADFNLVGVGSATVLTTDESSTGAAKQPQATIGEDGDIAVAWNQMVYPGAHYAVRGARFTPTKGWSSNSTLSPMTEVGLLSCLTNTRDGRAAVIWNQGDISGGQSSFWLMPFALQAA